MKEVLPCECYSVSYKLPNGKEASIVLYSSMMVGMYGCVPSHAAADEAEYRMDFVSRIRHFAVALRESLVSKAVVTTNAHGQLQDSSTNHLALSVAHLDNSPRPHPANHAQAHLQAQLDCLESSSHVHPCAQVVTSPGLNSLCQVHPPAQMDSSHGTTSPVHLTLQREGCETEHHQKDCSNAEFLRLADEENIFGGMENGKEW